MSTIEETIARLRELDRYASPAPWSYNPWSANSSGEVTQNITYGWGEDEEILIGEVSYLLIESDAEMIAESRNSIPLLLEEIERLTTENAKAWDDGYKHGQLSGIKTHRTGHVHPYKNPSRRTKNDSPRDR